MYVCRLKNENGSETIYIYLNKKYWGNTKKKNI